MRFPHVPVTSLEDATENFELLQAQWGWGRATVSWPGSANLSSAAIVAHGLGHAPKLVLVTPGARSDGSGNIPWAISQSFNASSFTAFAETTDQPAAGTTAPLYWLAIG